jgi:hypothetical protein
MFSSVSATYAIRVERGKSYERLIRMRDASTDSLVPLGEGWNVRGQIRTADGRTGTTTASTLLLDLSENDRLSVVEVDGVRMVRLYLTAEDTVALNEDNAKSVKRWWSCELFDESAPDVNVRALLSGAVVVLSEVTR